MLKAESVLTSPAPPGAAALPAIEGVRATFDAADGTLGSVCCAACAGGCFGNSLG
jgi:hypothetical protein